MLSQVSVSSWPCTLKGRKGLSPIHCPLPMQNLQPCCENAHPFLPLPFLLNREWPLSFPEESFHRLANVIFIFILPFQDSMPLCSVAKEILPILFSGEIKWCCNCGEPTRCVKTHFLKSLGREKSPTVGGTRPGEETNSLMPLPAISCGTLVKAIMPCGKWTQWNSGASCVFSFLWSAFVGNWTHSADLLIYHRLLLL